MLRRSLLVTLVTVVAFCPSWPSIAVADPVPQVTDPVPQVTDHDSYGGGATVTTTVLPGFQDSNGTTQSPANDLMCYANGGAEIPCWSGDYPWNTQFQRYCRVINPAIDDPIWTGHLTSRGHPTQIPYSCIADSGYPDCTLWADIIESTPQRPGADPISLVKSALSSVDLHAPTVGVGAYVYPKYEQWGLSWWVGAPMWLWVDAKDDHQWGTHTISATADGLTVTATVTAKKVSFDPGDGSPPVTCRSAGTFRPWNVRDPLSHHSPSGCEYTYPHTNELGNMNSRYEVSATVTWEVVWTATDGEAGSFTVDVPSTSSPSIHVGEIRAVMVPDPLATPR